MIEHLNEAKAQKRVPPFKNRWRFDADITTNALLHIGSGETVTKTRRESDGSTTSFEANAVVTDCDGHAYLPGKAIKGALRSWLSHAPNLNARLVEEVFGSEDTSKKDFVGGKAEFCDAFAAKNPDGTVKLDKLGSDLQPPYSHGEAPLYWDAGRLTITMAHTAIARTTKTVRDEKLYHEEFVPPGVTFTVIVTAQNLTDDEAALLLFALRGFGHSTFPVRLGAGEQDLRGSFSLVSNTIKISRLTREGLQLWFDQRSLPAGKEMWQVTGGGYDGLPPLDESAKTELQAHADALLPGICPPNRHIIRLRLRFDPAFMVHDPSRGQAHTGDPTLSDHRALLDTQGDVLLPADSFRGAFRSQAEKILRTLRIYACDPQGPNACKAIHAKGEERTKLCPACRIFGAGGWASALQVSDFTAVMNGKGAPGRQDFVAIDRFTGGASGSKKFDAEPYWNPVLEGTIALELDRAEPWALGLIALTLRDLIEGDITFGFGAAKGYGACTAEVVGATNPALPEMLKGWEDLAKAIGEPAEGDPWGGLDLQLFVGHFRNAIDAFINKRRVKDLDLLVDPAPTGSTSATAVSAGSALPPQHGQQRTAVSGGTPFYNPYHFVPVKGTEERAGDADAEAFFKENKIGHVTHDRYIGGTYSGRILCRLIAEDPFVVGSEQVENEDGSHTVTPFMIDQRPAIPSTSLRGLISSIAEAASNGALRVLDDRTLSVRMAMVEALPAIGMVRETTVNGRTTRELQPLTFPTNIEWDSSKRSARLPDCLGIYQQCSPGAYVEGYRKIPNPDPRESRPLPGVEPDPGTFLANTLPASYSSDNKEFWWAKLPPFTYSHGAVSLSSGGERLNSRDHSYLVGSQIRELLSDAEYRQKKMPSGFTRGILRVLGFEGHEKEIPHGKKHEIFIPFSSTQENLATAATFPMEEPLAAFEKLAAQRHEEQREDEAYLPFDLKRPRAGRKGRKEPIRLRDGDLVFFKASGGKITEIALSSIWRKGKESVHVFFASVSPELLPMNSDRKTVSLAELLFGFVEELAKGTASGNPPRSARALAGRVYFSFGLLDPATKQGDFWEYSEPKALKLLASPKPPCPALYFCQESGAYIMKRHLKVGTHLPQGRKFYLHREPGAKEPWLATMGGEDKHSKQRLYVTPVKRGSSFYFHVDFHNLSKDELGLLCYALQPSGEFRHKLGLGKPIGLGKVQIEPLGLFYVPRTPRYTSDKLKDPRFLARRGVPTCWPWTKQGERYAFEAATGPLAGEHQRDFATFEALRKTWRDAMDQRIRWAIELIGNPASVQGKIPVHYPRLKDQGEEELYRWFMENENKYRPNNLRFPLPPIVEKGSLPTLPHLTVTPNPNQGNRNQARGGGRPDRGRNRHP